MTEYQLQAEEPMEELQKKKVGIRKFQRSFPSILYENRESGDVLELTRRGVTVCYIYPVDEEENEG